jgi:ribosomal protein L12E/L44/L45/RPP1/RPP2
MRRHADRYARTFAAGGTDAALYRWCYRAAYEWALKQQRKQQKKEEEESHEEEEKHGGGICFY